MTPDTARGSRAVDRSRSRTWGQRFVLVLNVALIAASVSTASLLHYLGTRAAAVNRVALDRSLTSVADTTTGERVVNILLVGSDSSANLDPDDPIQIGRQGERLGDVIIIAHLDERTGEIALLSLPRDLWVPIAGAGRSDRINRSFVTGGAAGLIQTIEEAFDIPIHHYVNVDFAGFQGLVEAVGTVEVPFDAPARDWNVNAQPEPRSQTGFLVSEVGCHALGPEQALAYVRSRYYQTRDDDGTWRTDPTSDLGRIRRQQDFLQRLLQRAIERGARNPMVLTDLIDTGIENVSIDQDLTPALLLDLSATYRSFEPGDLQTYTYPTSDSAVGASKVLRPRHEAAQPLLELFRGSRFDDPDTITVRLLSGADPEDGDGDGSPVDDVEDALDQAGYEHGAPTAADPTPGPGLRIRYGPQGRGAAEVVARDLLARLGTGDGRDAGPDPADLPLEPVDDLDGRTVEVVVGPSVVAGPALDRDGGGEWAMANPDDRSVVTIDKHPPPQPDSPPRTLDAGDTVVPEAQPDHPGGCT